MLMGTLILITLTIIIIKSAIYRKKTSAKTYDARINESKENTKSSVDATFNSMYEYVTFLFNLINEMSIWTSSSNRNDSIELISQ